MGHMISLDYLAPEVLPGDAALQAPHELAACGRVFKRKQGAVSRKSEPQCPRNNKYICFGAIENKTCGSGRHDLTVQLEAPRPSAAPAALGWLSGPGFQLLLVQDPHFPSVCRSLRQRRWPPGGAAALALENLRLFGLRPKGGAPLSVRRKFSTDVVSQDFNILSLFILLLLF